MEHSHHVTCCKHEHIKFCPKCNKPYCEDCGKEWEEKCNLNHYYPIWTTPTVSQPWITYTTSTTDYVCEHSSS